VRRRLVASLALLLLLGASANCFASPTFDTLQACQDDDRMISQLGAQEHWRAEAFARCVRLAKAATSEGGKVAALETCPK
jgi:hypothetical protein